MTEGSHEPTYKCLSNDGLKKLISLNPIDHLKLEQKRRIQKNMFIVNNKYYVCPHGHLHPLKEIFGKNILAAVYNGLENNVQKILG